MDNPQLFLVTSYGRSATYWLASALSLHPEIVCSHGPVVEAVVAYEKQSELADRAIRAQSTAGAEFYGRTLRELRAALATLADRPYVGNIHAFTAFNLENKRQAEDDAPLFRTVNLIRHPLARIQSFWRHWQNEHKIKTPVAKLIQTEFMRRPRYQEVAAELRRSHDVALRSFNDRAFFHAVMQMSTDLGDIDLDVPQIVMERLVADIDFFAYVLALLTDERINISLEYLRNVQALGRQNASQTAGHSVIEIFDAWSPWQRDLYRIFLRDHPLLSQAYTELGYNLVNLELLGD